MNSDKLGGVVALFVIGICVIGALALSRRIKFSPRHAIALALGFIASWVCLHVASRASVQTGFIVPVDVQVYREVFRWIWFPFSWLPEPVYIGTWQSLRIQLIGVPYGVAVGLVVFWLFRSKRPKKI